MKLRKKMLITNLNSTSRKQDCATLISERSGNLYHDWFLLQFGFTYNIY